MPVPERKNIFILVALLILAATISVYLQVQSFEFIGFDESDAITNNPYISNGFSLSNLAWAVTSLDGVNWHPMTWLTHMSVSQFFGMDPGAHHVANVAIHAATSVLVLLFLYRLTGCAWRSLFVAAVFALHPAHVESVAWVAERKDVLSGFFWFLTLLLYSRYAADEKRSSYLLTLSAFAMGLMSKSMVVSLPLVLMLLDFWPLNRFSSPKKDPGAASKHQAPVAALLIEKLPFFLLSFATGLITVFAQHREGAVRTLDELPLLFRLGNAVVAYYKYIELTFWPHDLAVLYPIGSSLEAWKVSLALSVVLGISFLAYRLRHRLPYVFFGWYWFIVTLLPVIGIMQIGLQSRADRYLYLPMTGLSIIVAWGVPVALDRLQLKQGRSILSAMATLAIIIMTVQTYQQVGCWRNDFALFGRAVQVTEGNFICYNMLGVAYQEKGDLDSAIRCFEEAANFDHRYVVATNNLGVAYYKKGRYNDAMLAFQRTLAEDPENPKALRGRQVVMGMMASGSTFP